VRKEDKNREIIRIVLNKRCDIQYASIDNKNAIDYIKKLDIVNRLLDDLPVQYDLENYHVTIDEVNITDNMYYVITAVLEYPKCENCRKALTDAVTGLYNRNYWEQIISDVTLHPRTQNFSLILIDVDNLKEMNDTLKDTEVEFTVKSAEDGRMITYGKGTVGTEKAIPLAKIPAPDKQDMFIIEWSSGEQKGMNTYLYGQPTFDYRKYKEWIEKHHLLEVYGF
jgi:hypothetical protein